jgi:hypothetical protein
MAALNSGIDFVSSKGFSSAKEAAAGSVGSYAPFFAMGGSNMRYETGSHVDSKGYNFALGMAREIRGNRHTLLTGPLWNTAGLPMTAIWMMAPTAAAITALPVWCGSCGMK